MSWRKRMGPASFRGVPFHVEATDAFGGRRTVVHEYPFRDRPFVEDMGRKGRGFQVEGYVLGDAYLAHRDALIAALEEQGPGELVHPYHGTRRVICSDFTVRESTSEGGVARFSIEFVESDARAPFPTAVPDSRAAVKASVERARRAVGAEFGSSFRPGLVGAVSNALRSATLRINTAAELASMPARELALLHQRVDRLVASAASLAAQPGNLLAALMGLVGMLPGAASRTLYAFDPGVLPPPTTSSRRQERQNVVAVRTLVQRLAMLRAAELAPGEAYESHEAAVEARTAVTDLLDEQSESAGDEVHASLVQLRADLVKAVPGDAGLARLLRHTPRQTVPSLVLAHQLYGDLAMEADLLARNRVRHPGFLLGGRELEVLSRG